MNGAQKIKYVKMLKGIYNKIDGTNKITLEGEGVELIKKLLKTEIQINWIDTLERRK